MTQQTAPEHPMAAARESTAVFRTGSWRFERPVFVERTAPCAEACPLGEDIPAIMDLHGKGLHAEALEKILEENPFPGFCGHSCFHPCERVCNRARFDEAVSIRDLERFAAERAPGVQPGQANPVDRRLHAAVLGGSPDGLACAWFLARLGWRVTLFEPESRLALLRELSGLAPDSILEREVGRLTDFGIEVVPARSLGPRLPSSLPESCHALYQSSSFNGRPQGLDTEPDRERVLMRRDLRHAQRAGKAPGITGTVAVAGRGIGALEAARRVRELGGRPVILSSAFRQDYGAAPEDLEAFEAEGIDVRFGAGLRGLIHADHGLRIRLGGRSRASDSRPSTDVPLEMEAGALVFCPSLKGAQPFWIPRILPSGLVALQGASPPPPPGAPAVERSRWALRALAAGKRAALSLDLCLRGQSIDGLEQTAVGRLGALSAGTYAALPQAAGGRRPAEVVRSEDLNTACFRNASRSRPPAGRSLTTGQAVYSARRCFRCGRCTFCGACDDYCPDVSVRIDRKNRTRVIDYEHCKGCGICVRECPRGAIVLEKERTSASARG